MIEARRRLQSIAVVGFAIVAGSVVMIPQPASAASPNTHRFSESTTFVSAALSICVDVNVSGTINYNATRTATARGAQFSLTSIHLFDPVIRAVVHDWTMDAGCTTATASVDKMSLKQHWSGYGADPTRVTEKTPYGRGSSYTQYNSGWPGSSFANVQSVTAAPTMCYRLGITAEYAGVGSGSAMDGSGAVAKKVCATPTY